jgi:hypothetical protein
VRDELTDGLFTVLCDCGTEFPAENEKCACGLEKGQLKLDIDKFLNRVYDLHTQNRDDRALDVVFETFWHLNDKFDLMNEILGKVDLTKVDEGIMVGFMVQTFKYIAQVPNHLIFLKKVEARMKEIGRSDRDIAEITQGFRETGDYWKNMKELGAPAWLSGPKP